MQIAPLSTLRGEPSPFGASGTRRVGMRELLVVVEVAMAMMLLVGGGLLIHSFVKLSTVNPGYNPEQVLTFQISLPVTRYPDARLRSLAEEVIARCNLSQAFRPWPTRTSCRW